MEVLLQPYRCPDSDSRGAPLLARRLQTRGRVKPAAALGLELVVEAFVGALGEWRLELVEERDVVLQVGDEEVGEVTRHPVPDHNAERGEILAILGEGVRGDEPTVLA